MSDDAGQMTHDDLRDRTPLHALLGLESSRPEPGTGRGEVRMPVRPEAFGPTANLHGGAIATMVDLACALAAVSVEGFNFETHTLVTTDMHIRYLGRARGDEVVARAEVIRNGSQLVVVNCAVADSEDHLIASADFSMMKVTLRKPLIADAVTGPGALQL